MGQNKQETHKLCRVCNTVHHTNAFHSALLLIHARAASKENRNIFDHTSLDN